MMEVVAIATNAMLVLLCATMPSPSSSCYYAIVTTQDVMVAKPHTTKEKKGPSQSDGGSCYCCKCDGNVGVHDNTLPLLLLLSTITTLLLHEMQY